MKYIKVLTLLFTFILLSACNGTETTDDDGGISGTLTNEVGMFESPENLQFVGNVVVPIADDRIMAELAGLAPMPYLIRDWENDQRFQLLLMDLTTGDTLAIHKTGELGATERIWNLNDGHYVVESLDIDSWSSELVIFDKNLNLLAELPYDTEALPLLLTSALRIVEGELFVYGLGLNENWATESTTDLQRVNVHTGEIESLFEIDGSLTLHQFIDDNRILFIKQLTDWEAGQVHTHYGILDLETGETSTFERENFAPGEVDVRGSKVLIGERHVTDQVRNEVIVFDSEEMTSQFIQLEDEESLHAHLSFDGHHIVTINEEASVFRKYDLNGERVAEIEIEFPSEGDGVGFFEIFPITEQVYAIHTFEFPGGRHIQFIMLP